MDFIINFIKNFTDNTNLIIGLSALLTIANIIFTIIKLYIRRKTEVKREPSLYLDIKSDTGKILAKEEVSKEEVENIMNLLKREKINKGKPPSSRNTTQTA